MLKFKNLLISELEAVPQSEHNKALEHIIDQREIIEAMVLRIFKNNNQACQSDHALRKRLEELGIAKIDSNNNIVWIYQK